MVLPIVAPLRRSALPSRRYTPASSIEANHVKRAAAAQAIIKEPSGRSAPTSLPSRPSGPQRYAAPTARRCTDTANA